MPQSIVLNKRTKTIKVVNRQKNIRLQHTGKVGPEGEKGDKGDTGYGMPTGGLAGELLRKRTNADYDIEFISPNAVADKNYVQNFTTSSIVTVNHGLNKLPSVNVIDSAGDEVVGQIFYVNPNSVRVSFAAPFSGQITCN